MIFPFERLPGAGPDIPRPALELAVTGSRRTVTIVGLLDTGALHNRLGAWVADLAGVDVDASSLSGSALAESAPTAAR